MPFNPTPAGPSFNTLAGIKPDPQRMGDRTLQTQLGGNAGVKLKQQLGVALPSSGGVTLPSNTNTTPLGGSSTPSPTSFIKPPSTSRGQPTLGGVNVPGMSTGGVIKTALSMANEDTNPRSGPPPMPAPDPNALPIPPRAGLPEYMVSTPYTSGPGLNESDMGSVSTDPTTGRPVITIKTPTGITKPKSSPWLMLALLAGLAVAFAD